MSIPKISLSPQYLVVIEGSETEEFHLFETQAKARIYAEDLARLNRGATINLYEVVRPVYYMESCRLNAIQWFLSQPVEERDRG